jgi:hypothetical protein
MKLYIFLIKPSMKITSDRQIHMYRSFVGNAYKTYKHIILELLNGLLQGNTYYEYKKQRQMYKLYVKF